MSGRPQIHVPNVRTENEKALGIIQRAAPINFSWAGDIRKRYTDFLVYEILKDGTVIHLQDYTEDEPAQQLKEAKPTQAPPQIPAQASVKTEDIPDADREALENLVGEVAASQLIAFDQAIQSKERLGPENNQVVLDPVAERDRRATIHQEIRRIFSNRIETLADNMGVITATRSKLSNNRGNRGGRGGRGGNQQQGTGRRDNRGRDQSWAQLGGDYLHFTLYKENKDTMEAINTIARLLKVKASNFGFTGTKDRRAGTVQRVSLWKQRSSNLNWLNTRFNNMKVGDYSYHQEPLQLGQHSGNEFIITLKNCRNLGDAGCSIQQRARMIQESVEFALAYVRKHGYINYYGLQRFGTYSIGTQTLGMKLLNEDYKGTVEAILHVNDQYLHEVIEHHQHQGSRDDYNRAKAISTWRLTSNADKALELMPKRFSSEISLIRHLGRNPNDYLGAILSITRGMRMMYIHAYQSYVWNFVATHRWSMYGANVVEGDLILVDTRDEVAANDGMDIDVASNLDDENFYAQARALTADDVASGKYTIFDVVLPTPGYDVIYPQNDVGEFYKTFMSRKENGALDPYNMRRRNKEFSLSGNYRPLVGRFLQEPQYTIRLYSDDTEQMYPTDLDICKDEKEKAKATAAAATNATRSRWAGFTDNATFYDDAVAADRRRKASEEPPLGEIVTNETWVQTGLDGSAKRIKVAREKHQEREAPSPTKDYDPSVKIEASEDVKFSLNPVSPLQQSARPQSSHAALSAIAPSTTLVVNNENQPLIASGDNGSSHQQLRTISSAPSPLHSPQMLGNTSHTNDTAVTDYPGAALVDSRNPMAWFGGNTSVVSPVIKSENSSALSDSAETLAQLPSNSSNNDKHPAGALVIPEFYSPSENPFTHLNGKIEQSANGGDKIAVVLKFQLKSSNYATVVLRELMGDANFQG
ncbi:pseudouridine synthase [Rhypophila decipiens]